MRCGAAVLWACHSCGLWASLSATLRNFQWQTPGHPILPWAPDSMLVACCRRSGRRAFMHACTESCSAFQRMRPCFKSTTWGMRQCWPLCRVLKGSRMSVRAGSATTHSRCCRGRTRRCSLWAKGPSRWRTCSVRCQCCPSPTRCPARRCRTSACPTSACAPPARMWHACTRPQSVSPTCMGAQHERTHPSAHAMPILAALFHQRFACRQVTVMPCVGQVPDTPASGLKPQVFTAMLWGRAELPANVAARPAERVHWQEDWRPDGTAR